MGEFRVYDGKEATFITPSAVQISEDGEFNGATVYVYNNGSFEKVYPDDTQSVDLLKFDTYEQSFTQAGSYTNAEQYQQDMLEATLTAPSDSTYTVKGFWDGGDTHKFRFAPSEDGKWTWETSSPFGEDSLSGKTGSFNVGKPSSKDKNNNRKYRGPPTSDSSNEYVKYADEGTKFLWVSDTAFDLDDFPLSDYKTFIDDRADDKNFRMVMNATVMGNSSNTPGNDIGDYFATKWNEINPDAIHRMDEKVKYAHDKGIVTWWQPIWIGDAESNTTESERNWWWRHCLARFQGYNMIWAVYGDHGETTVNEHDRMASKVRGYNGRPDMIITTHAGPTSDNNTTTKNLSDKSYMDMHSHQTHGTKAEYTVLTEDTTNHTGPFANVEPGIKGFGGENRVEIRRDQYQVMFSGLGAGTAFGHKEYSTGYSGITSLDSGLSNDVRRCMELLESFDWYNLTNDQALITSGENSGDSRKIATKLPDGSSIFVYYPDSSSSADLDLSPISTSDADVEWYDPTDATRSTDGKYETSTVYTFTPPWSDPADALLIAKSV